VILSIDLSYRLGLACLELEDGLRLVRHDDRPRRHMAFIQKALVELEAESGRPWVGLSRVAVTVGPGSFTGLRVALAAAKGLVFGREIPLLPLASLALPARASGQDAPRAVLRRARGSEFWAAFFPAGRKDADWEGLLGREELGPWLDSLSAETPELRRIGDAPAADADLSGELGLEAEPKLARQLEALADLAREAGEGLRGKDLDALLPCYGAEPSITLPGGPNA